MTDDVDARDLVERAFKSDEACSWCAAPLFRIHETPAGEAYDTAPEADQAYFAPTEIDGRPRRGGKRTYCEACGRTEPPAAWENRTTKQRHEHLDHVLERADVDDLDTAAAHTTLSELNCEASDATDLDVLAAAVEAALPDDTE